MYCWKMRSGTTEVGTKMMQQIVQSKTDTKQEFTDREEDEDILEENCEEHLGPFHDAIYATKLNP